MREPPYEPVSEQELAVIEAALPAMLDGLQHGWGDILTDHLQASTETEQQLYRESLASVELARQVLPRMVAEVRRLMEELRRSKRAEEQLQSFIRSRGLAMDLQHFMEQHSG